MYLTRSCNAKRCHCSLSAIMNSTTDQCWLGFLGDPGALLQQLQGPGVHLHMACNWRWPCHSSSCHDLHPQGKHQAVTPYYACHVLCCCTFWHCEHPLTCLQAIQQLLYVAPFPDYYCRVIQSYSLFTHINYQPHTRACMIPQITVASE